MVERRRLTVRDRKNALKKKRSLKRRPKFLVSPIKGRVIYQNPNAMPVKPVIMARGKRQPFKLANVEWISIRSEIIRGGYGVIYKGGIKFKGKASSERVVIKRFKELLASPKTIKEIIQRLNKSGVAHPKMAFLQRDNYYLVMEPFMKRGMSKFMMRELDLIGNLDLTKARDKRLFKQAIKATGDLAKEGLMIKRSATRFGKPRVDVFNAISLKNGDKIFVQDIDSFALLKNRDVCWRQSINSLLKAVSFENQANKSIAKKIITKIAKEMGFPQK